MDCSFRDGFQSCIGARAKTEDFAPALEAAAKAGIEHIEIGGGARFQSLFFYTQENAFEEMDKWREIVGKDVNLQTLSRGVNVVGLSMLNCSRNMVSRRSVTLMLSTTCATWKFPVKQLQCTA